MAPRPYTAEEKGKAKAQTSEPTRRRIRAPEFDTSSLIRDNALTIIGRVVNPKEQPIGALISALPKKWPLKGNVEGADLGLNCFQFRFDLEEDLLNVLENRPYHHNHWMVILQRWEPVISPLFSSQIPFWVRLQGLPLHFWHEKMIYRIGHDLGTLEDYKISKTSARMKITVDGLKPLVKETVIDFSTGEALTVTLEYEGLEYHCTNCNNLTHLSRSCPLAALSENNNRLPQQNQKDTSLGVNVERMAPQRRSAHAPAPETAFNTRVDRHGRPFGDRLPPLQTVADLWPTRLHRRYLIVDLLHIESRNIKLRPGVRLLEEDTLQVHRGNNGSLDTPIHPHETMNGTSYLWRLWVQQNIYSLLRSYHAHL